MLLGKRITLRKWCCSSFKLPSKQVRQNQTCSPTSPYLLFNKEWIETPDFHYEPETLEIQINNNHLVFKNYPFPSSSIATKYNYSIPFSEITRIVPGFPPELHTTEDIIFLNQDVVDDLQCDINNSIQIEEAPFDVWEQILLTFKRERPNSLLQAKNLIKDEQLERIHAELGDLMREYLERNKEELEQYSLYHHLGLYDVLTAAYGKISAARFAQFYSKCIQIQKTGKV